MVLKLGDIEDIVAPEAVSIDHAIRLDLVAYNRNKRVRTGICDDCDIDLALPLEQPEDWNFACCTASALALPVAAKVALIDLDLARQQLGRFCGQSLEDYLAQLVVKQDRRVAVDARYLSC